MTLKKLDLGKAFKTNEEKDSMLVGNPKQEDQMPDGNPIHKSYAGSNESNNNIRVRGSVQDLTPIIILKAKYIQNILMDHNLIALIDPGSRNTMIKRSALPYGTRPSR